MRRARPWEEERVPNSLAAMEAGGSWSVLVDAEIEQHALESFLQDAPGMFAARRAHRAIDSADSEEYGQGLRELFRQGQSIGQGRRYLEQFAPDYVVTENPSLTATDPATRWGSQ